MKEIMHKFAIFVPERQGLAIFFALALVIFVSQAGYRGERSFHEFDDLADGVVLGGAAELIAAAFAAGTKEEMSCYQILDDDFQVFLGNLLPGSDLFQRYVSVLALLRQVKHDAQGVAASSGNHIISSFVFDLLYLRVNGYDNGAKKIQKRC